MFELDEEYAESDIPTVLIRSKADCPIQEVTLKGKKCGQLCHFLFPSRLL